mmetsp:Transcript_21131/g.51706  ORF Transcript_21131/g.51706 Transcript_21131/m.51706 type:complete len:200 (+) Transcript_21131:1-600(+)
MEVKVVACSLQRFGCPVKSTPALIQKHEEEDVKSHLNLLRKAYKMERSKKEFRKEASECATKRCEDMEAENSLLRRQLIALELLEQVATGDIREPQNATDAKDSPTTDAAMQLQQLLKENDKIHRQLKKTKEKLDKIQEKHEEDISKGKMLSSYGCAKTSMFNERTVHTCIQSPHARPAIGDLTILKTLKLRHLFGSKS